MPAYASICQHIEQLRDFADEAVAFLLAKDPNFKPSDATMWQDHAPVPETTDDPTANLHLGTADDKLQNLSKDARQKAWEHDSLSLARDVAAIAKMHQQVLKNDKADRLRRVAHVRSENMIVAQSSPTTWSSMPNTLQGLKVIWSLAWSRHWKLDVVFLPDEIF